MNFLQKIRGIEHFGFWLFIYLFIFDYHLYEDNWLEAICFTGAEVITYMIVFYLHYEVLLKRFLDKKQHLFYVGGLILLTGGYMFLMRKTGLENFFYEIGGWRNIFSMLLNVALFCLMSTMFFYYKKWQRAREEQLLLKSEKLEAELRFLKNQISPHFIFNSLNNIYSLMQQSNENAAPMLAKLSKILRYLLYDGNREEVSLEKEIEVIEQYIELQLMRKPTSENIDFYKEGNFKNLKITPLILLSLVENAFKHGDLDTNSEGWLKVNCISADGLEFSVENSSRKNLLSTDHDGIGNENIRRQLALKYPDHSLQIENSKDSYLVNLKLKK